MKQEEVNDLLKKYPALKDVFDDVGCMMVNGAGVVSELNEYIVSEEKRQQKDRLIDMMAGDEELGIYDEQNNETIIEAQTMPVDKLKSECVDMLFSVHQE